MGRILIAALVVALAMVWFAAGAGANGTVTWVGHGSEHAEGCELGHWVFTTGGSDAVTGAVLFVDGVSFQMTQHGQGSFSADAPVGTEVHVRYTGTLGRGSSILTLSHCIEGEVPTPTPTDGSTPTSTPTDGPTPTPTDTPVGELRCLFDCEATALVAGFPTTGNGGFTPGATVPWYATALAVGGVGLAAAGAVAYRRRSI